MTCIVLFQTKYKGLWVDEYVTTCGMIMFDEQHSNYHVVNIKASKLVPSCFNIIHPPCNIIVWV